MNFSQASRVDRKIIPAMMLVSTLLVLSVSPVVALSVKAAVEKQTVTVGEPFLFQIQLEGSETPEKPDLSHVKGFTVEFRGTQMSTNSYTSIINGRPRMVNKNVYLLNYSLAAKQTGDITIPPISVRVDNATAHTNPIRISVTTPQKLDTLKLRLTLSKTTCYVGEPILLTVTWYLAVEPKNPRLSLPFLAESETLFIDDPMKPISPKRQYYTISTDHGEVTMGTGRSRLDGRTYTTLTLEKIVIPRRAGEYLFSNVRALCKVFKEYKKSRRQSGSFFDGFFNDNIFSGRQAVYNQAVVPAPTVTLRVKPLPETGRPAKFSGLVGSIKVTGSVTPREVKVGEPMMLTMRFSGMQYVKHIPPPDLLSLKAFTARFKVPKEMAPGKPEGAAMVFSQTIRPKDDRVTAVPPVEVSYFDVDKQAYAVAKSTPIQIDVEAVNVITLTDAEGSRPITLTSVVKSRAGGIAHNYTGLDVLQDESFSLKKTVADPIWLVALFLPLLFYFTIFFMQLYRESIGNDPSYQRRRRALKLFKQEIREAGGKLADPADFFLRLDRILRNYLADILTLPAGQHSADVMTGKLRDRGVSEPVLSKLRVVIDDLEAGCFGGLKGSFDGRKTILGTAKNLVASIQKEVRL